MSADPTQTPSPTSASPLEQDDASTTSDRAVYPLPFGSYLLLHRIGRGGMGDVFLAKAGGLMGIEKHCVVKTLRSRFTDDPEYVQRFVEEARIVVQLSHRNICGVFDVGRVGPSFYLGMELVLGRNVRSVVDTLGKQGAALPPGGAMHIACELLDALDYAHRHADPATGDPLHLVHRDVSPQNVLVNFEGEVKLIDFGLAETGRAITAEHSSTGSQAVMGKLAYMAPEHARGEIVDARADQFSAAIVAFELFTGERYWAGYSPKEQWARAGIGDHVPHALATLDVELQEILRRALAAEKSDRFESCGSFRDALLEHARKQALPHGGPLLRALMNELFDADLVETRELLRRFANVRARPATATPAMVSTPLTPLTPLSATSMAPGGQHPVTNSGPLSSIDMSSMTDVAIDIGPAASSDFFSIATSTHAKTIHDPTEAIRLGPTTSVDAVLPSADHRAAPFSRATTFALSFVGALTVAAVVIALLLRAEGQEAREATATAVLTQNDAVNRESSGSSGSSGTSGSSDVMSVKSVDVQPRVEVEVEVEPSTSSTRTKSSNKKRRTGNNAQAQVPAGSASTSPVAQAATLAEKLSSLKRCRDPCAAPVVAWEGKLDEHPDVRQFKQALEACLRQCR